MADAQQPARVLPMGPARERGASITPAFEGWYKNDDGSFSLLIGYYNRNSKEPLTIPIGPNNKIEPGDPDQGQPTFFETGRQWGVFVIKVPKDFGEQGRSSGRITSNGETQSMPFTLNKGYPITPYKELGMLNEPPMLRFTADGPKVTGPPTSVAAQLHRHGRPAGRDHGVRDDVKERDKEARRTWPRVSFHKHRGPGDVKFDSARIAVDARPARR